MPLIILYVSLDEAYFRYIKIRKKFKQKISRLEAPNPPPPPPPHVVNWSNGTMTNYDRNNKKNLDTSFNTCIYEHPIRHLHNVRSMVKQKTLYLYILNYLLKPRVTSNG